MANKKSRKAVVTTAAAIMAASAVTPVAAFAAETSFSDVPSNAYYADAVKTLVSKGVLSGYPDGTFKPTQNVKRSEAAKILTVARGWNTNATKSYPDVAASHWAYGYIAAASNAGAFGGDENGNFNPEANLTRAQAAKIIVEAYGLTGSSDLSFKDAANIQSWAVSYIKTAVANGILKGDDNGNVNPNANIKRADFAEMIQRAEDATAAPKVVSVSAINNKEIVVTFNKAVDKDVAESISNYTLTAVTSGGAATLSSAKVQADGKTVILTLGTEASNQETYKLTVKNLKDTTGKTVETTEKEVKFFDAVTPTVTDISVVAPRTVKLTFSEPIKTAPNVKLDNGSISTTVTLSADKKSATVEFGIEPTLGNHELEIEGGADYANLKIEKIVKSFDYQKDEVAPTVSVEKATANTVKFKFSKPVSVKAASDITVYHTVNNSGAYVGGPLTPESPVNGYSDTYTVTFGTPLPEGTVKVFLNTKANALEDGWGNDVASVELSTSVVIDKEAPSVTGVKAVSDKKLEVTFSEDVNSTDAQKLANYILKDASGKVLSDKDYNFVNSKGEFLNTVTVSYSQKKATITLPSSLKGGNYSLTVKEIKDASFLENKLTSQDVQFTVTDTTPWDITTDALRSADNKKIRIQFNENMSTEGLTDLSKYELRNDSGNKVDFPEDTKVVVLNPKAVEIQLGAAEPTATTIRVSGTLKDAAGNTFNELFKQVAISPETGPALVSDTAKTIASDKVQFEVNQELKGSLDPSKFTSAGVTFGGASYVNKDGKSTVTLTLATSSTKFAANATPTITVTENALESIYGAKNSEFEVEAADGIAPSVKKDSKNKLVISNTANTDNITVAFNEELLATNATLAATDLVITDAAGKTLVAGVDYTTTIADDTLTIDLDGNYDGYEGKVTVSSKTTPVYIKDAAGNVANSFAATEVTIGDSTAPVIAEGYPSATAGAGTKKVTVKVKSNENGKAYMVVLANDANAPTAAQVKAGKDDSGNDVATKATVNLTANAEATHDFELAADDTDYDVFIVLEDAAGNLTAVQKLDVKTPAGSGS